MKKKNGLCLGADFSCLIYLPFFVDKTGKTVVPFVWNFIDLFSFLYYNVDGMIKVKDEYELWGLSLERPAKTHLWAYGPDTRHSATPQALHPCKHRKRLSEIGNLYL